METQGGKDGVAEKKKANEAGAMDAGATPRDCRGEFGGGRIDQRMD